VTPHELAQAYPAPWQIQGLTASLRLYDAFKIGHEAVTLNVKTHSGLLVEVGYRGLVVGKITKTTPEGLVEVIGEKIAHMIAFHPGVITLEKIPPWVRSATARALETHEHRIRDTKTHLERSAP